MNRKRIQVLGWSMHGVDACSSAKYTVTRVMKCKCYGVLDAVF